MKLNKRNTKKQVSNLFAFCLTLLFFLLYVCMGFTFGVFNQKNISNKLNESRYYKEVYKEITKNAEAIVQKAGFSTTILKNAITLENVHVEGNNYIKMVQAGKEPQIKTGKQNDRIKSNLKLYLDEKNIQQTDQFNSKVNQMIFNIDAEFQNSISLPFVRYMTKYRGQFQDLMKIIFPVLLLLISILCWFLVRMHRHRHHGLRYIACALIASSTMIVSATIYLLLSGIYRKLDINPEYYQSFINALMKSDINIFLYFGGTGLILSVVLISFTGSLKHKLRES